MVGIVRKEWSGGARWSSRVHGRRRRSPTRTSPPSCSAMPQRLAEAPALIDGASGRALTYGELAAAWTAWPAGSRRAASAAATCSRCTSRTCPSSRSPCTPGCAPARVVTPRARSSPSRELADQVRRAAAAAVVVAVGPLAETARAAAAEAGGIEVLELGELLAGWPASRPRSGPTRVPPRCCCPRAAPPACPKLVELTHRALVANLVQMRVPYPAPSRAAGCSGSRRSSTAWACSACCTAGSAPARRSSRSRASTLEATLRAMAGAPRRPGARRAAAAGRARAPPARRRLRPVGAHAARQRRRAARPRARARRGRAARLHRRLGLRHHRGRPARGRRAAGRAGGDPHRHLRACSSPAPRRRSSTASCGCAARSCSPATATTPPPRR